MLNEGVRAVETMMSKDTIQPKKLAINDNTTFTDLVKDYELFSHAALLLYGNIPFDPLLQFYAERNSSDRPYVLMVDMPLFEGLDLAGDNGFNHLLFAVPKAIWPAMEAHFGSVSFADRANKVYLNSVVQRVPMFDYLAFKHDGSHKAILINLVAIDGNHACIHFVPAKNPPTDRIKLFRDHPRPITAKFARSYFDGTPSLERDKSEYGTKIHSGNV